ncbi:unnamed protein product [Adineta steineri]|uniref:Uncharacterized protein n=1 Tax=Adineta steineri TaxID=433720 RepID=A0A814ZK69_9BILA|nr:unnamed protein product [Adineta steineri]CAF1530200.1 unnamed protein product [Adineta steineri]
MRYYQQIIIAAIFMQLLVSCWARTRFISDPLLATSGLWNDVEEIDNTENNNDHIFAERAIPWAMKAKKAYRAGSRFDGEERRKKYLGEPVNYQGGHSLQGLWAMPGRR